MEYKRVKSILTKSKLPIGGYTANPYEGCTHGCTYCYAEYMARFQGRSERWGEYVCAKEWPDVSERDLAGERVWVSSVCDPYQPVEATEGRTRELLEQLERTGAEVTVCTRSNLVRRDFDLLARMGATLAVSLNTTDEQVRADLDRASTVDDRLETLYQADTAGIRTVLFCSPMLPGITDLREIALAGSASSVDEIWVERLVLNGRYRGPMLYWCRTRHPEAWPLWEMHFVRHESAWPGWVRDEIDRLNAAGGYPPIVDQGAHGENPV